MILPESKDAPYSHYRVNMDERLTIGDLAKATGTKVVTVRYYEQAGLLPAPPRTSGSELRRINGRCQSGGLIADCRIIEAISP